jgi:hypothetical protein
MIDSLGDVGDILGRAGPEELQNLYEALHPDMTCQPDEQAVDVRLHLTGRGSTLFTRCFLGS